MSGTRTSYARIDELPLSAADTWLSPNEQAVYRGLRAPERQRTWLAGRIAMKRLLLDELIPGDVDSADLAASSLHIDSRSDRAGHGQRPNVLVEGRPLACSVSLAHTDRGVLAAVCLDADRTLGVDLVRPSQNAAGLVWTLTEDERLWLQELNRPQHGPERLWAMKEAIYKACQRGEGFAPRGIDVVPGRLPQYPRFDMAENLVALQCWSIDGQIAALAIVKSNVAVELTNRSALAIGRAA